MTTVKGSFNQLLNHSFYRVWMAAYKSPPPDINEQWEMWINDPTDETFTEWRARMKYG